MSRAFRSRWFRPLASLVLLLIAASAGQAQSTPEEPAAQRGVRARIAAARQQGKSDLPRREWDIDGTKREALLYIPESAKSAATPVVFAFHGHGGNMQNAATMFHIHTVWPEAIAVYMTGLNTPGRLTDLEGKKPGWQHSPGHMDDRDLKFFDAVLASLKADYKVDDKRIYSTGHSNGGGFTYLLWRTRGDVFAAVAPSAAAGPGGEWTAALEALKPKPVMHLAGEKDPLVKFEWQKATMEALRKLNGCDPKGTDWAPLCKEYPSKTGAPVVTLIHPGAHNYPQEGPELIVKFFKEHAKP